MVNPISTNAGNQPYLPAAIDLQRPVSIPEPAIQVTAVEKSMSSGSASTAANSEQQQGENPTTLDMALEQINDTMKAWSTGLKFNVDPELHRVVVSIIDNATGEVLRTVPSEAVIRVAKTIVQLQGMAVNTKA
ncbi:hypothetical protein CR155_19575 [Pollutimonas nitritireducens]|uniref:Flagellar protein FlaG n=1 Tax=Pollutimonas nitritireducens TaxID=2045209 RepID=A0A2N4UB75_9BURK|nr:flagellar protein FlaG [Pollutimonas nitritireducens]PLC52248.1 hypothetical protein CR155_19575 [Pollutimonas nitritireducens]